MNGVQADEYHYTLGEQFEESEKSAVLLRKGLQKCLRPIEAAKDGSYVFKR